MSKIGKKIIIIPEGVGVKLEAGVLELKANNKSMNIKIPAFIKTEIRDKTISFSTENDLKQTRANWGTVRSLTQNAVLGLIKGFEKVLEIEGVGYRVAMEGDILVLNLGLSHPVKVNPPEGIKISVEKNTVKVSGYNKELVGRIAAEIRALKKPEPYKGKGIHYQGEIIRRKTGKKVLGTTAKPV